MKKIFWIILALTLFIAGGYFTVSKIIALFHQPVYGIVLYSDNKNALEKGIQNNNSSIKKHITIDAKYIEKNDTLVLNTASAKKLIQAKAVNSVSKKDDNFTFKHISSLPKTPALWSSDTKNKNISDEKGQNFTALSNEYIVLGESSVTSKILVLDYDLYHKLQATPKYIGLIEEKRDASQVLSSYSFNQSQIFSFEQK